MVQLRYSGGSNNSDPNSTLGGSMSLVQVVSNTTQNLFDKVLKVDLINRAVDYRCVYVYNESRDTIRKVRVEPNVSGDVVDLSGGLDIAIGTEAISVAYKRAQIIDNESTAPTNVTFYNIRTHPILEIPGGKLNYGEFFPIWIRRTMGLTNTSTGRFGLQIRSQDHTDAGNQAVVIFADKGVNSDRQKEYELTSLASFTESVEIINIKIPSEVGNFNMGEGVMG